MTEQNQPEPNAAATSLTEAAAVAEPPAPQPPAAPPSRWRRILAGVRHAGRRALLPSTSFWILFLLILVSGAALRTYRMDMPPYDFPADRQHTNAATIELLRQGEPLLNFRNPFMELRLYPWITARTSFLCKTFDCQIWTLARFWSAVFGMLTVVVAALAGYWAAGTPGASRSSRRRIALFMMAALAFNPYHILISHMISTESFTLAMQMCAVAAFWIAYRNPGNLLYFLTFIAFFVLSGWAKIPSLIWAPGFMLYFLAHPAMRGRAGRASLIGGALFIVGGIAIFWVARINPFRIAREYENSYPYFAHHMQLWMGSTLWTKAYLGRIALMLTLPGVLLATIGFLSAPWLFRITTLVFLVCFYGLVNLNTYNFCHILIPGAALAAWGANSLLRFASGETAASLLARWSPRHERWQKRLHQATGMALGLFFIFWLYPKGPAEAIPRPTPRGEVEQAMKVIKKIVPAKTWVYHDDGENSLSYMLGQTDASCSADKLDLRTGFYYLFERFTERPLLYAGAAWVKWASLPSESGGILFSRPPAELTPAERARFIPVAWPTPAPTPTPAPKPMALTSATQALAPAPAPTTATQAVPKPAPVATPAPPAKTSPLEVESLLMPQGPYDAARRTLIVHPGQTVTFGIAWKNPRNYPLAGVVWRAERWQRPVTVPLREGGFSIAKGGVLCLPEGARATACYTFEIPQGFPTGVYSMEVYPLSPGPWREPEQDAAPLPFKIVCDSGATPSEVIDLPFLALYPAQHFSSPQLWSDSWRFGRMALQGDSFGGTIRSYFLACPMRPAGVYEITIRGEAEPLDGAPDPAALWPYVEFFLPSDLKVSVARITLDSRSTSEFKATFTAMEPFDTLMIRAVGDFGEPTPVWLTDFNPVKTGHQLLNLRSLRLAPQRKILPGLIDSLHAAPKAAPGTR